MSIDSSGSSFLAVILFAPAPETVNELALYG